MDVESKMAVIRRAAGEILTEEGLRHMFETEEHPIMYDGFEPSGIAPIHFALPFAANVNKMLGIGMRAKLYLADYFAFINNKVEGDIDKIRTVGMYFIEVWKGAGIDPSKVEIIWAKDLMQNFSYWERVLKVGKAATLDRVKRAITIMGRKEGDSISAAQIFYPVMQANDIFDMDVSLCYMGMDQRKANVLAMEAADKYGWKKPVAAHRKLVLGLKGMPQGMDKAAMQDGGFEFKMSKSDPTSAIYVHDTYEQLKAKISGAYCPEKIVEGNPLLNYVDLIITRDSDAAIRISRPEKFGGDIEFETYAELEKAYSEGKVHPLDLKAYVTDELEKRIKPIREHFENDKAAAELYEKVKTFKITK